MYAQTVIFKWIFILMSFWHEIHIFCKTTKTTTLSSSSSTKKSAHERNEKIKKCCKWCGLDVCFVSHCKICVGLLLHSQQHTRIHHTVSGKQYHQCGLKLLDLSTDCWIFTILFFILFFCYSRFVSFHFVCVSLALSLFLHVYLHGNLRICLLAIMVYVSNMINL